MALLACLYLPQVWQLIGIMQTSGWIMSRFLFILPLEWSWWKAWWIQGARFHVCTHFPRTSGPIKLLQCTQHVVGVCLINNIMAQLSRWETSQAGGKCQSAVSPIIESKQAVSRDTDLGHGSLSTHALSKSPIMLYRCVPSFVSLHMWGCASVFWKVRTHLGSEDKYLAWF